jgi:alkyldihydroxyacetonephosphate synthase
VSLDLERLNRVLEVDPTSRAARIQAGALGPELEAQLKPTA